MTFASEKVKAGRRPFAVVELDMDECTLTYGIAPCIASLTGAEVAYDVSTMTYDGSGSDLDVNSEDTFPVGITISSDGLHLYMAGTTNDKIYAYTLSVAYDLSTATYDGAPDDLDVNTQTGGGLQGVTISSDGLHIYVVGSSNVKVHAYTLSAAYDLSSATYDGSGDDLNVNSEDNTPVDLAISSDGLHLYILGTQNDQIYAYTLSAAYDLSSATYDGAPDDLSIGTQDGSCNGLTISSDGLHIYMTGTANDKVHAYTFSVAYDLSSATYDGVPKDLDVSVHGEFPVGITISSDGLHLYLVEQASKKIYAYTVIIKTGDAKCFNTFATCQDTPNFTKGTKTYSFITPIAGQSRAYDAIPSLRGLDEKPIKLDPGRSLGKRGEVICTFQDHPHHDRGVDKYALERAAGTAGTVYTPFDQGSFWGKFLARNPHHAGRTMRVKTGFLDWDKDKSPEDQPTVSTAVAISHMLSHTYQIETIHGPDANGRVQVIGKDFLKLIDDDRAEVPVRNTGLLSANLGNPLTVLKGAVLDSGNTLDTSGQLTVQRTIAISANGSYLFVAGNGKIWRYTLATPYDLSTATYAGTGADNFSIVSPSGVAISDDGLHLLVSQVTGAGVFAYTLGSANNLTTVNADAGSPFDFSVHNDNIRSLAYGDNGKKLFIAGVIIYSYTLGTAYDLSTAVYDQYYDLVVDLASGSIMLDFDIDINGLKVFTIDSIEVIRGYTLSIPWNMRTAVYDGDGNILDVSATISDIVGVTIGDLGAKLYVGDGVGPNVESYSLEDVYTAALTPGGVGNSEYAASGTIRINDELMGFTRSGDALALISRGSNGTDPTSHDAGSLAQQCHVITDDRVENIIERLMEDFGGIPSAFIDTSTWQAEAAAYLFAFIFSAVISEPVGLSTLISELCEQALAIVYWDVENAEFIFTALRTPATDLIVTDAMVIEGSFRQIDLPNLRLSRVTLLYGKVNPTTQLDDATNFPLSHISIDTDAEGVNAFNNIRHRNIGSRWMGPEDSAIATLAADAILARYVDTPQEFRWAMDAKDASIWTGSIVEIQTRFEPTILGAVGSQIAQVIEARRDVGGVFHYKAISI